jgi:hypothetical protein
MSSPDPSTATSEANQTAAEWQARFGRYLEHSAESLKRTAELNRELVKRIACGDIAPVIVESQLAAFMATRAASFAEEMADVTTEFLARLVGVNSWYARTLVEHARPGGAATTGVQAPRIDRTSIDWFERLNDHAKAETAALQQLLSERQAPEGIDADDLPTTLAVTADVFLDVLTRLEDINTTYGHRYLEAVLGLTRESDKACTTLHAVAPIGETATVRFAVRNNTDERADIRCVLTDVRRSDGVGPAFEPDATIMPNGFGLAAGEEEVLTFSVRLAGSDFTAGPVYSGGIRVMGVGDSVVDIPVDLRASMAESQSDAIAASESG